MNIIHYSLVAYVSRKHAEEEFKVVKRLNSVWNLGVSDIEFGQRWTDYPIFFFRMIGELKSARNDRKDENDTLGLENSAFVSSVVSPPLIYVILKLAFLQKSRYIKLTNLLDNQ